MKDKYSDISIKVLESNNITEDKIKDFVKELRVTLRLDFELKGSLIKTMNDNQVIEKWFEFNSLPENIIGGAND